MIISYCYKQITDFFCLIRLTKFPFSNNLHNSIIEYIKNRSKIFLNNNLQQKNICTKSANVCYKLCNRYLTDNYSSIKHFHKNHPEVFFTKRTTYQNIKIIQDDINENNIVNIDYINSINLYDQQKKRDLNLIFGIISEYGQLWN